MSEVRPIEVVIEDVAFLVADRVGLTEAAARVGATSPEALDRRLRRAGRRDLAELLARYEPLLVGDDHGSRTSRAVRAAS